MIRLYSFCCEDVDLEGQSKEYFELITSERRIRLEKYVFLKDKILGLYAEILLRYALWDSFGILEKDLCIEKNQFGKPRLRIHDDIHYNLSHSGKWVICGIGDRELGVDVEEMKDTELFCSKRVLTDKEYEYVTRKAGNACKDSFFQFWTLKESYIKKIGLGLQIPLNSLSFDLDEDEPYLYRCGEKDNGICFFSGLLDSDYRYAICLDMRQKNEFANGNIIVSQLDLLHWSEAYKKLNCN